jgi:hypothetical protein
MLNQVFHAAYGRRRYLVTVERTVDRSPAGPSYCIVVDAPSRTTAGEVAEYAVEQARGGVFHAVDVRRSFGRRSDVFV